MTKRITDDWVTDARGQYPGRVGYSTKPNEKLDRHMFHFGTDLAKAKVLVQVHFGAGCAN